MKKLTTLLLCVVTLFSLLFAAHAADRSEYQAVLDKINAEYGTNARFATPEELALIGSSLVDVTTLTLDEFEQSIIKAIQSINAGGSRQLPIQGERYESPYGDSAARTVKAYYENKRLTDCTVHLSGTVSDANGFWQFAEISHAYASPIFNNNGVGFSSTSYTYSFLDTRRTCSVTVSGWTMTQTGIYIIATTRNASFTAR